MTFTTVGELCGRQLNANSGQFSPTGRKAAEKLQLAEWLSLPSWARDPKTQKELAETMGVDPSTFSDWKKLPNFMRYVRQLAEERVKEDHADVLGALVLAAKKGNVQAQRLYLEYVQEWI